MPFLPLNVIAIFINIHGRTEEKGKANRTCKRTRECGDFSHVWSRSSTDLEFPRGSQISRAFATIPEQKEGQLVVDH